MTRIPARAVAWFVLKESPCRGTGNCLESVFLVPKTNATAGFAVMDNHYVFFAISVFDLFGEARLEPTGHIRLTGENEQVSLRILATCGKVAEDHQAKKAD